MSENKKIDEVYAERDRCVALLARMAQRLGLHAGIKQHEGNDSEDWDPEWTNVICIDLPAGQVSWHIHESELPLFEGLPAYTKAWDGHSTEEKYRRVINPGFFETESEILNAARAMQAQTLLRRFRIVRHEDVTGISGTGVIATGVQLPDKRIFLLWLTPKPEGVSQNSTGFYENEKHVVHIHCHNGASSLEWID